MAKPVKRMFGREVGNSEDLKRILALPRREKPDLDELSSAYTEALRRDGGTMTLHGLQAWALHEGRRKEGLIAPLAVGTGKGLLNFLMPMVMPRCERALLLIPASLKAQVLSVDYPLYSQHFWLPNVAGAEVLRVSKPMPPTLFVVTYTELQHIKGVDLLKRIEPDLIICDEVHNLKTRSATRVKRLLYFLTKTHKNVRFCGWSGTITSKSIKDYAHLTALALGEDSPVPLETAVVEEWAAALDANTKELMREGALRQLCEPSETAREGFARRLVDTEGVVASSADSLGTSLEFEVLKSPTLPDEITKALAQLRRAPSLGGWKRPDGEELVDAMRVAACAKELACGFFYRWKFPRGEPPDLIDRWFDARQAWNRELRVKLQSSRPYLDSPYYCEKAAERYYAGGCEGCARGPEDMHTKGCTFAETKPLWPSQTWLAWTAIEEAVEPEQEAVWISDFLVDDVAAWAAERPGIVWTSHVAFAKRLSAKHGLPYFGQGKEASATIIKEVGNRSIVASADAHNEGKNLQTAFCRNLIVSLMSDESLFEQVVGRTHRQGQPEDAVTVDFYLHTKELNDALVTMRERARYVQTTTKNARKLLYGSWRR